MAKKTETQVFVEYDGIAVYLVKMHKFGRTYRTLLGVPLTHRRARISVAKFEREFNAPRVETPRVAH